MEYLSYGFDAHACRRSAAGRGKPANKPPAWLPSVGIRQAVEKLFLLLSRGSTRHQDGEARLFTGFLTGFLALAVWALAVDLAGWILLQSQRLEDFHGALSAVYDAWVSFRARCIAPPVRASTFLFMTIFMVQSLDKVMLGLGCFWIKQRGIGPRIEGGRSGPCAAGAAVECPMVLVQIPMCNEKEVYQQSISSACNLDWPRDRLLIQVLDDSSDESIRSSIEAEVSRRKQSGMNIVYRHRPVRSGYKAGNLKSAMSCDYVEDYEFVVIFDADFQPSPDYLKLTIPHFKDNPRLGLVQARWALVNRDANLLTRLQHINMCHHFEVEQQVSSAFLGFFGFNGTAGVWRIRALEESGGWLERTTVEDMDIAVRAHLAGWRFIFLNNVKVLCEAPESFEAYRKQQQRWHSGPMHLFRLCFKDILKSKLPAWKKGNLVLLFFLLRKLIIPASSFLVLCVVPPLTMFVPEAELPLWFVYYVPFLLSLLNVFPCANSLPLLIPYLLFENTMSATKFGSVVAGVFQPGGLYEWVVTKKSGRTLSHQPSSSGEEENKATEVNRLQQQGGDVQRKSRRRIYGKELTLGLIMLTAALRSLLSARRIHFFFLVAQGVAFFIVGFGLVGEP